MRTWTLVVSICAHAAAIAVVIVAPLFATEALPAPRRAIVFETIVPIRVPPIPSPAVRPVEGQSRASTIPAIEPDVFPTDAPLVDAVPPSIGGCDHPCAIVGEAIGGVVDGSIAAPPAAKPPAPPVRVGSGIRPPARVSYTAPIYPPLALAAKKEGVVILEALLDEEGAVRNVKVLRSIPLLDDAAVGAVSQWRFTPTLLNGTPVPVVMTVTVSFTLTN
jgi:protein TonB